MLSNFIDRTYYAIRFWIWGPAVPWNDGTVTPEGRELHERVAPERAHSSYSDAQTDFPDMRPRLEPVNGNG